MLDSAIAFFLRLKAFYIKVEPNCIIPSKAGVHKNILLLQWWLEELWAVLIRAIFALNRAS
jgi:hypothetical protein